MGQVRIPRVLVAIDGRPGELEGLAARPLVVGIEDRPLELLTANARPRAPRMAEAIEAVVDRLRAGPAPRSDLEGPR